MKSWRTTLVAIFGALVVFICLILVAIGESTLKEVSVFLGGLTAVLTPIGFWMTKDAKASHSKELEVKIKELEEKIK